MSDYEIADRKDSRALSEFLQKEPRWSLDQRQSDDFIRWPPGRSRSFFERA